MITGSTMHWILPISISIDTISWCFLAFTIGCLETYLEYLMGFHIQVSPPPPKERTKRGAKGSTQMKKGASSLEIWSGNFVNRLTISVENQPAKYICDPVRCTCVLLQHTHSVVPISWGHRHVWLVVFYVYSARHPIVFFLKPRPLGQPQSLELLHTGKSDAVWSTCETCLASWPLSSTNTTFSVSNSSAAAVFNFFDKLKLKASKDISYESSWQVVKSHVENNAYLCTNHSTERKKTK